MYKVDSSRRSLTQRGWAPDFSKHPATRAQVDGETVDAKAITWTDRHVQLKWVDDELKMHTQWVPATAVTRISREESSWKDPYDQVG